MKKTTISLVVAVTLVLVISTTLISRKGKEVPPNNLEKVRVQAGWILNGEFANICSAIGEGYYADEGLDVELIPGGPTGASFIIATNVLAQDESIDIAVDGDIVPLLRGITKDREEERMKVKAFAAFWQDHPYGFMVRKDSGISNFIDLATKRKADGSQYKIGITADSVSQYAIAKYAKISVDSLNLTTVGFDASPFLLGQVDALSSFWTTQAYEVEKAGIEYNFLNYSEIPGFSQPSMVAIAREETLRKKPELLAKWLKATIKGSEFVKSNPDKARDYVLSDKCGGPSLDSDQELWIIKKSLPLFGDEIGIINKEQILNFAKSYNDLGQIPFVPEISEIVDESIISAAKK